MSIRIITFLSLSTFFLNLTYSQNSIENYIQNLKHPNSKIRKESAYALGEMSLKGISAIPFLIEAIQDSDPKVRFEIIRALGMMGESAQDAISVLIEQTQDEDESIRAKSAWALGNIGISAKNVIPILEKMLKDKSQEVCERASWALNRLDENVVDKLATCFFESQEEYTKIYMLKILGNMSLAEKQVIPFFEEAFKSENKQIRYEVISAVGKIFSKKEMTTQLLREALTDQEQKILDNATNILCDMGKEAESAVPQLIEILCQKEYAPNISKFLGKLGEDALDKMLKKFHLLKNDSDKRAKIVSALSYMETKDKKLTLELIRISKEDKSSRVRRFAIFSLGEVGQPDITIPYLIKALESPNPYIRWEVLNSILKFQTKIENFGKELNSAEPILKKLIHDQDEDVQQLTIKVLSRMGIDWRDMK